MWRFQPLGQTSPTVAGGLRSATTAFGPRRLHWRARDGRIGAIDAAVASLGFEHRAAALAVVEPLAGVSGHRFILRVAALGAGNRRGEFGPGGHFAAFKGEEGKPASAVAFDSAARSVFASS